MTLRPVLLKSHFVVLLRCVLRTSYLYIDLIEINIDLLSLVIEAMVMKIHSVLPLGYGALKYRRSSSGGR